MAHDYRLRVERLRRSSLSRLLALALKYEHKTNVNACKP